MKKIILVLLLAAAATLPMACSNNSTGVFIQYLTPSTFTPSPTRTSTPGTSTPTAVATLSVTPGSAACSGTDNTTGFPSSGSMTINPSRGIVPLCNGWLLLGDRTHNQITLLNAVSGSVSQTYQLTGAPNEMAYDSTNNLLYVGIDSASILARVNISTGVVTNITLANPVTFLCIGPSGKVFVEDNSTNPWWNIPVELVNGTGGVTITSYANLDQGYVAYDSASNLLLMGQFDISSGPLYAFSFNNTNNTITSTQTLNTNGFLDGWVLSPDNNHLGVMEGGAGVVDFTPTNFNTTNGSWPGGVEPQAGAFSPDSSSFTTGVSGLGGAAGHFAQYVYSTTTHAQTKGVTFVSSNYYEYNRVGFSAGGGIVYSMVGSNAVSDSYQLFWFLNP